MIKIKWVSLQWWKDATVMMALTSKDLNKDILNQITKRKHRWHSITKLSLIAVRQVNSEDKLNHNQIMEEISR